MEAYSTPIEQAVSSNHESNETGTRKKSAKKRDRSPSLSVESSSVASLALNASTAPITIGAQSSEINETAAAATTTTSVINQKKEKQRPETWNKMEQQIFFNALRQNGKNFESITQYFNARQKRFTKSDTDPTTNTNGVQRSREQIRHFYYRTLHKITKYVSIPMSKDAANANTSATASAAAVASSSSTNILTTNNSLRDTQVRCLIAYHTLMNKSLRWNKKTAIKLVELIDHGKVKIVEKGKITRLRMPICKVSSKTISKDELETSDSLPLTINIHLEPKSESAFCRVHRLAQNPFLNIEIQTLQSVKFLIEFLENKWKNRRSQFIEKFQLEASNQSNKFRSKNDTNITAQENVNSSILEKLILYPSESHQISNLDLYEEANNSTSLQKSSNNLIPEELQQQLDNSFTKEVNKNVESSQEITSTPGLVVTEEAMSSTPQSTYVDKSHLNYENLMTIDDKNECYIDENAILPDNVVNKSKKKPSESASGSAPATVPLLTLSNNHQPSKPQSSSSLSLSLRACFKLNVEQLKAGLTAKTSKITSNLESSQEETKDLTLIQLYLALNKPSVIRLKYDWILTHSTKNKPTDLDRAECATTIATSSSLSTLASSQNQQQRFYIETLANVGASFLNDIQSKNNPNSNIFVQPQATSQPYNNNNINYSNLPYNGISKATDSMTNSPKSTNRNHMQNITATTNSKNINNKSPPDKLFPLLTHATQVSSQTNQPILAVVPIKTTAPIPSFSSSTSSLTSSSRSVLVSSILNSSSVEHVLKQFNEEQNNKTKKLLSDLNTKRRSRQRKSIMVVNTGIPPRNIVPKLNFNNLTSEQITSINNLTEGNNLGNNQSLNVHNFGSPSRSGGISSPTVVTISENPHLLLQQQQNIVYSKPVAAVARQIVNNVSMDVSVNSAPSSTRPFSSGFVDDLKHSDFNHMFANVIENAGNVVVDDGNNCLSYPAQTLSNMSLLDISLNNSDSFLGNLNGLQSNNGGLIEAADDCPNGNASRSSSNEFISLVSKNDNSNSIMASLMASNNYNDNGNKNGAFSSVSVNSNSSSSSFSNIKLDISNKICQSFSQILNENSNSTLTNIINSFNANTLENSDKSSLNVSVNQRISNNNNSMTSGFSLTHKRSDICVEWTDSMNDVSLTGCYLNDIHSPEKPSKNSTLSQILNENSRDSMFFNVDTIMEILPTNPIRYEDKSLID
jgi:hypothetical protein